MSIEKINCLDTLFDSDNKYSLLLASSFNYDEFAREENIKSGNFGELVAPTPRTIDKKYYKEYIYVNIEGEIFTFKTKLKHIAAQIEEAKEILKYADNWDGENSEPTDMGTFIKSSNFIHRYSSHIEGNYGAVIQSPYMDILRDGSIYLNWETANSKFIIIFKKNIHPLAYFYGERIDKKGNKIPFKSAIEIDGDIDEITAQWMKTYLI
jgi:hypothetical protein